MRLGGPRDPRRGRRPLTSSRPKVTQAPRRQGRAEPGYLDDLADSDSGSVFAHQDAWPTAARIHGVCALR
jgi:hypothetical protein